MNQNGYWNSPKQISRGVSPSRVEEYRSKTDDVQMKTLEWNQRKKFVFICVAILVLLARVIA